MKKEILDQAYSIIVEECGASDGQWDRLSFLLARDDWTEWQFCGHLGFGGKIWQEHWPKYRMYVTCYQEDETPEIREMIDKANERLKDLTNGGYK